MLIGQTMVETIAHAEEAVRAAEPLAAAGLAVIARAPIPYGRNVAGASSSGKGMTNEANPEQDAPATLNHQQEEILL